MDVKPVIVEKTSKYTWEASNNNYNVFSFDKQDTTPPLMDDTNRAQNKENIEYQNSYYYSGDYNNFKSSQ